MQLSSHSDSSTSAARVAANRANSQLSTGPKTPEGKAKSSLNAVKNGLTGRTVLLPGDDAAVYERHLARFISQFNPAGERETELVQSLADTQWRLNRIPSLEMGIYAVARLNLKDMFQEEDPEVREALIQAQTFITYHKQLNNLSIQEARLRRHYQKDLAELQQLQQQRLKKPAPTGFVFSTTPASACEKLAPQHVVPSEPQPAASGASETLVDTHTTSGGTV